MKEQQEEVHEWVQQFVESYWPDFRILKQMMEELGEITEKLKEAHTINGVMSQELSENLEFVMEVMRLGEKARALNKRPPKKADGEPSSLGREMSDLIMAILCLANSKKIEMSLEWKDMMLKKLYGRDKDRFVRKDV